MFKTPDLVVDWKKTIIKLRQRLNHEGRVEGGGGGGIRNPLTCFAGDASICRLTDAVLNYELRNMWGAGPLHECNF